MTVGYQIKGVGPFGGHSRPTLRTEHADNYEEWTLSQERTARNYLQMMSGSAIDGAVSPFCL